jgi:S1-C subfamily serine protease
VYVTTTSLRRNIFSLNVLEIPEGTGSGFLYDSDGHIVTNFHVIMRLFNADGRVQSGFRCRVTLSDRSEYDAQIVGVEPDKDVAVLRIDAPKEKLAPLAIGTSHDLQVGQKVFAIGNPFGLDQTLTTGIVSALGREIRSVNGRIIRDVIQTDAAINPGNSGGPLLDGTGRLIGMNTQIATTSGSSAGIGFAVPVDIINQIVPDIIRYGVWKRPVLGVNLVDDRIVRSQLGLRGVLIDSVREGSGAEKAGLRGTLVDREGYVRQLGDLIVKINETDVSNSIELKDVLDTFKAGDAVGVEYVRDGKLEKAQVELQLVP